MPKEIKQNPGPLVEGRDYYLEKGYMVFTKAFLLARGYCCDSGCRHCPYKSKSQTSSKDENRKD